MKFIMPLIAALSLSACMSMGKDEPVTRAATGSGSCANLTGVSAQYLQGSGVRCGPQSSLPYTIR